jgi:glycerol transport system ATP-binding protein
MAQITLDGIAHAYGPRPKAEADYALRPLHLIWQQGMAYALLGPSGCGKTTLLNIISGLVQPTVGRLLFDGKDVTALPTERRNIAQVFQFPVIYDTMTVGGNLAFPLRNRGMRPAQVAARVAETAAMLGLADVLDRPARNLSADAKQKISLGRGLVRQDVAAVLFDEPLTVIDPGLKWELRSKLKAVHRALDLLMIYVTHDQTEALTFADQVVVMNGGQVLQVGTPAELFDRPDHTFVGHFIGSPGMNLLPAVVAGTEAQVGGHRLALAGQYAPQAGRVQVGVRPDFAELAGDGLPVQVDRIDDLGRVRLARVRLGPHPLVATVPPDAVVHGSEARLRIDPARIHVYADDVRVTPQ